MDYSSFPQKADSLPKTESNHVSLSPISFLERSAQIYPHRTAVIDGNEKLSYRQLHQRTCQLAGALTAMGIQRGEVVSTLGMNSRAMLEAHYGVPMMGGVLNAINARLDSASVAFIMTHANTRVLIYDRALQEIVTAALPQLRISCPVLIAAGTDTTHKNSSTQNSAPDRQEHEDQSLTCQDYETLLTRAPLHLPQLPADEWEPIALNYTSGTTGNPKGVVYSHRGAYLNAMSNTLTLKLRDDSVYLWTLPMFHCNGWTHTWAVTAAGGTHVCMSRVDPTRIIALIHQHGVTHMAAAPIVMTMILNLPEAQRTLPHSVMMATGGAAPDSTTMARMSALGFEMLHLYGMTETYGPSLICQYQSEWSALTPQARAAHQIRQGVGTYGIERVALKDPVTHQDVPADGKTLGHLMLRGNTVMKGYRQNPEATQEAMGRGWLDTGDIAVMHEDGYIEIRDRAKDIIISGGESISSIEIEEIMMRHPAIREVAVIARPHDFWGETPHAFVVLEPQMQDIDEATLMAWCREHMAHFKAPRHISLRASLPRTSTGKLKKYALREHQSEQMAQSH